MIRPWRTRESGWDAAGERRHVVVGDLIAVGVANADMLAVARFPAGDRDNAVAAWSHQPVNTALSSAVKLCRCNLQLTARVRNSKSLAIATTWETDMGGTDP